MGQPANRRHHRHSGGDPQALADEAVALLVQQGKDVCQRHVDEAGSGDDQHVGERDTDRIQDEEAEGAAEDCAEAGGSVGEKGPGIAPAGIFQQQEVAHFLRHFVRDDGHGGCNAEHGIGDEGSGNQDAIDKIVEAVAHQNQQGGGDGGVVSIVRLAVAV